MLELSLQPPPQFLNLEPSLRLSDSSLCLGGHFRRRRWALGYVGRWHRALTLERLGSEGYERPAAALNIREGCLSLTAMALTYFGGHAIADDSNVVCLESHCLYTILGLRSEDRGRILTVVSKRLPSSGVACFRHGLKGGRAGINRGATLGFYGGLNFSRRRCNYSFSYFLYSRIIFNDLSYIRDHFCGKEMKNHLQTKGKLARHCRLHHVAPACEWWVSFMPHCLEETQLITTELALIERGTVAPPIDSWIRIS